MNNLNFAFLGGEPLAIPVLQKLYENGLVPQLIVCNPDKPKGRNLEITPPPTKVWAEKNNIPYIQLKTLKKPESEEAIKNHSKEGYDFFVVASYGKIIPQNILDIPKYKTLNVHPSLLPKLRGPSPIKSAILTENETGVSIMLLDAEMDHGPLLAQKKVEIKDWPPYAEDLEKTLGKIGGEMLVEVLPLWLEGKIKEKEQDHSIATICKKIEKSDGEIDLNDEPDKNLRKIRGYQGWPTAYFFTNVNGIEKRIVIKTAHIENGQLFIDRVIPEGKKEINYKDFLKNQKE